MQAANTASASFASGGCKRDTAIIGKFKVDSKFKCQICANKQGDITLGCQDIELHGSLLK